MSEPARPPKPRIGIRYDLRAEGTDAEALQARHEEILDHAAGAEGAGVDVLWVAERPFVPGAAIPAALPLCAALAERTRTVRIATGALPLPLHHPLRVAEDAATLDVISGGRFELGVGLGEHAEGFDGFGVPIHERAGRFEEALDSIRRAWTEPTVGGQGSYFEIAEVSVHPRPTQRPHPPLWIAGRADAAVRRAARLGTGLLTDSFEAARRFQEAWTAEDRPEAEARIAWHVDPDGAGEPTLDALAKGLTALGAARIDLVLPALGAGSGPEATREALTALPGRLEALRSTFAA